MLIDQKWVQFNRLIKTIELTYNVSIYKAEPHKRKTKCDKSIGQYCETEEERNKLLAERIALENLYNIAIYKMERLYETELD